MPKGVYDRKKSKPRPKRKRGFRQSTVETRRPGPAVVARPGYNHRQGQVSISGVEPILPTVHIERGSNGDIRFGVRAPAETLATARAEAEAQFLALRAFVDSLKGNGVMQ